MWLDYTVRRVDSQFHESAAPASHPGILVARQAFRDPIYSGLCEQVVPYPDRELAYTPHLELEPPQSARH